MRTLIPRRCPNPVVCETSWHWGNGRWLCEYNQTQERAARTEQTARTVPVAGLPFRRGSTGEAWAHQQATERAETIAAHIPVQPAGRSEVVLSRNGERPLLTLDQEDLSVVGLLMCTDIFGINELLRNGGSLASGAGGRIDWDGYTSMQAFVDTASDVFDGLGDALDFNEEVVLFRGVGVPLTPSHEYPDIAGISRHLSVGTPWDDTFADAGFSFATTDPETALFYRGDPNGYPEKTAVLVELVSRRGLCVPGKMHRSTALFDHTFDTGLMAAGMEQVIFHPGTRWEITGVETTSDYGVPLVRMRQLVPTS